MKTRMIYGLLAGVSSLSLAAPAIAQATDAGTADDIVIETETAEQDVDDPKRQQTVFVTGSRLQSDGFTTPTPVTSQGVDDLLKSTPTDLPDALNKLPQLLLSNSPSRSAHNFANPPTHGNLLNLRGVGSNKTLILFDGLRVPPTTYNGDVDTNIIPNLLLDRVDIVTGGASAAYGSDAVAGVVNFVLDDDFVGVKGVAQAGMSQRGDNENYRFGLAGGWEVGNQGHLLLSAETYTNEGMFRSDREVATQNYIMSGSVPGGGAPGSEGNPFTIWPNGRLTSATENGLIISSPAGFPFAGQQFTSNGDLVPFVAGTPTGTPGFFSGGDGYAISNDTHSVAPYSTHKLFGRYEHEFGGGLSGYVQGIYSRNELEYVALANSLTGVTPAPIFGDNAFLPAELQAVMAPGDMISVAKYGANIAPKPKGEETTDFWMATAGLEGELGGEWTWDAAYTHGNSTHKMEQGPLFNWQKTYAALDAVDDGSGNTVCRTSLSADPAVAARFSDCVPFNIFLFDESYGQQAGFDYATDTSTYEATTKMDIIAANVQGSLFELPAGSVDIAVGGEFRTQSLKLTSNSDPALLDTPEERDDYFAGLRGVAPSALFYWLTNTGVADGSVDVWEGYAETNVPLISGQPFFESLDFNGAIRYTDYSTSGGVTTYKAGLTWRPVEDILFRGAYSRDIRAPNLFELFAGDQSRIGLLADPVSGVTQNIPQVQGGNVNLDPEKANTMTLGAVFTPSAIDGLSVAVDYYDIEIEDAIGTLTVTQIVANCAASGGSAPECSLVTRPSANEFPTLIRLAPANIASLSTSGVDVDVRYVTDFGPGELSLRAFVNYLDSFERQQSAQAATLDFAGYAQPTSTPTAYPQLRGTFNINYELGNFGIYLTEQYIGSSDLGSEEPNQNYLNGDVDPVWYTDLTLTYDVPETNGALEIFGTVNNLFDEEPPLIPSSIPGVISPTIVSVYDSVQRRFVVGARFEF